MIQNIEKLLTFEKVVTTSELFKTKVMKNIYIYFMKIY